MTSVNNSVWCSYQPDYVSPLYYPYLNRSNNGIVLPTQIPTDRYGHATVTTPPKNCNMQQIGDQGIWVNPDLVRQGWGQTFQKKHAFYPCPTGWSSVDEEKGFCVRNNPEFVDTFYTDKMYDRFQLGQNALERALPPFTSVQYFHNPEQKGVNPRDTKYWRDPNTNFRRVTGVYTRPKNNQEYATLKQRDSYLA